MTLTDFLLARIAEDEAELRDARYDPTDHWWLPEAAYPARVLAECEAKRRILDDLDQSIRFQANLDKASPSNTQQETSAHNHRLELAERIRSLHRCASLLALPYADHPDYREEWKP